MCSRQRMVVENMDILLGAMRSLKENVIKCSKGNRPPAGFRDKFIKVYPHLPNAISHLKLCTNTAAHKVFRSLDFIARSH